MTPSQLVTFRQLDGCDSALQEEAKAVTEDTSRYEKMTEWLKYEKMHGGLEDGMGEESYQEEQKVPEEQDYVTEYQNDKFELADRSKNALEEHSNVVIE